MSSTSGTKKIYYTVFFIDVKNTFANLKMSRIKTFEGIE